MTSIKRIEIKRIETERTPYVDIYLVEVNGIDYNTHYVANTQAFVGDRDFKSLLEMTSVRPEEIIEKYKNKYLTLRATIEYLIKIGTSMEYFENSLSSEIESGELKFINPQSKSELDRKTDNGKIAVELYRRAKKDIESQYLLHLKYDLVERTSYYHEDIEDEISDYVATYVECNNNDEIFEMVCDMARENIYEYENKVYNVLHKIENLHED